MGRVQGKVAFITGAARGQGRSHAVRLAEEGASIIAVDICDQVASSPVAMSTPEDLAETVRAVEAVDGRIIAEIADVREQAALDAVVARGVAEFGRLDIVSANAAIIGTGIPAEQITEEGFRDQLDINVMGVWRTVKASIPSMVAAGNGGSIILTSSLCGVRGLENLTHYVAAKHGVVGMMRTLANELGKHQIRVNAILPGNVATPMVLTDQMYELFRPDLEKPTREDVEPVLQTFTALDVAWVEARDISNALLFLASDEARFVTGVPLSVDGGWSNKGA